MERLDHTLLQLGAEKLASAVDRLAGETTFLLKEIAALLSLILFFGVMLAGAGLALTAGRG